MYLPNLMYHLNLMSLNYLTNHLYHSFLNCLKYLSCPKSHLNHSFH